MTFVYRLLRWAVRTALGIHYAELEVHGAEGIPREGPLLILANHHIGMIDPMLVMAVSERPVRYIAKSTLFKVPVLAFFMRQLGSIPAYRPQDPGYDKRKNLALYEAVAEALAAGGAVGIFPEGKSHTDPGVAELKHGTARMAFEAEATRGFQLGLAVQLVGIHFERTRGWRGKVLVHVAPPLKLGADARERYADDPREAVDDLTQELRTRLAEMVLDVETNRMRGLADLVQAMDVLQEREAESGDLKQRFDHKQRLVEAYRLAREQHPEDVDALVRKLSRYRQLLDVLKVRDGYVAEDYRLGRTLGFALRHTLLAVLGLPLVALSTLLNGVPYWIARIAARASRADIDVRTSVGLIVGIVLFPLWYLGLVATAIALRWDPLLWIPLVVLGPALGVFTARWFDAWRRLLRGTWGLYLTLRMPSCRTRLRTLRSEILSDVDALAGRVAAGT